MRAAAAAAWPAICDQYEGRMPHLYLDNLKLPTTGLGYRVVDLASMLSLPWLTKAGTPATAAQKTAEWKSIRSHTELAPFGGGKFAKAATLHLDDAEIDRLLFVTTDKFWATLKKALPDLETWPADAQLALMDQAWNMGPNFVGPGWPNFTAAAKRGDFTGCAVFCLSKNKSPRDYRHQRLYTNASTVVMLGGDPETLWLDRTPSLPVTPDPTPDPPTPEPLMHSSKWGSDYVSFRGGYVPPVVRDILLGIPSPVQLSQGGLSTSVAASSNTHAGLGAYDVRVAGWSKDKITQLCRELISCGECAFPRGPRWGSPSFAEHVHVCSNNSYNSLHPDAQAQVRDFKHDPRRNGLVGHGAYVGPSTPLGKWSDSPWNPVNIAAAAAAAEAAKKKKELELPTVQDVWNADIIPAPKVEKDPKNTNWKPGSYLVDTLNTAHDTEDKVDALSKKVDALTASVAALVARFPDAPTPPAA